jgi:hypothetical protein
MLDPSLLLSGPGLDWLEADETIRCAIAVPAVFAEWLRGERVLDVESLVAGGDLGAVTDRRARLVDVLRDATVFSYVEGDLPEHAQTVLEGLLRRDDRLGRLRADEWAFLQSHSTLGSKLKLPVQAFRDAGAAVVELGRPAGRELLAEVIPREHIPSALTGGLTARGVVKWIVVGGAAIGGGTLGALVGGAFGGRLGVQAAKVLGGAAVLAIDL